MSPWSGWARPGQARAIQGVGWVGRSVGWLVECMNGLDRGYLGMGGYRVGKKGASFQIVLIKKHRCVESGCLLYGRHAWEPLCRKRCRPRAAGGTFPGDRRRGSHVSSPLIGRQAQKHRRTMPKRQVPTQSASLCPCIGGFWASRDEGVTHFRSTTC